VFCRVSVVKVLATNRRAKKPPVSSRACVALKDSSLASRMNSNSQDGYNNGSQPQHHFIWQQAAANPGLKRTLSSDSTEAVDSTGPALKRSRLNPPSESFQEIRHEPPLRPPQQQYQELPVLQGDAMMQSPERPPSQHTRTISDASAQNQQASDFNHMLGMLHAQRRQRTKQAKNVVKLRTDSKLR